MYANDAALPADNVNDLVLSIRISEEFCNENRLFISVTKSFITVFHHVDDNGVSYKDDTVFVDGRRVVVKIYGKELAAAPRFKYLGVTLSSCGSVRYHIEGRCTAFRRAIASLLSGLVRIPGGSHDFTRYLWFCLVAPVASYGMELFVWTDDDCKDTCSSHWSGLRRLTHLGGRAPINTTSLLAGIPSCTIEWRVRRVALVLRLLNSPPDSLRHLALATFVLLRSPWFSAAVVDMQTGLPGVQLRIITSPYGPLVTSNSWWSDAGE